MLQPSKKGSESRQREELLKDDLEMTCKSRESLTTEWPFPSPGNQRRNKPWELTGYWVKQGLEQAAFSRNQSAQIKAR